MRNNLSSSSKYILCSFLLSNQWEVQFESAGECWKAAHLFDCPEQPLMIVRENEKGEREFVCWGNQAVVPAEE